MLEITASADRVYEKFKNRGILDNPGVISAVQKIMADVRAKGDMALREYTQEFDGCAIGDFLVSEAEISRAYDRIDRDFLLVIKRAAGNIRDFHMRQLEKSWLWEKEPGITLGQKITPLENVGIYVPGGTAPLISSVLMNAIPAKVAGVDNIFMCTPPGKDGEIDENRLVAAREAGVGSIYKAGGAQAIFAMAFGTESIPKADKITGPGNIYVANAKRMAYGYCDIDMIAGPSEVMIIADKNANPAYAAADLLSQAEHDVNAGVILCAPDRGFANEVLREINEQVLKLERSGIIRQSLEDYGIILVYRDLSEAISCANRIAPEHLELMVENARDYVSLIRNAGAIFIGDYSPEPLGDYYAGPNHTLPTGGTARFYSPLGVYDFQKRTSIIEYGRGSLEKAYKDIECFAQKEGLAAHKESISIRFGGGR
jgi:histidinol dehydrogenase